MSNVLTLSIDMRAVGITPDGLDNLASEYYGTVLAPASGGDDDSEIVVEFKDQTHPIFQIPIAAQDMKEGFKMALSSFILPKRSD